MKILHISYDYPDDINPNKTVAVKNIVDISNEFAQSYCISLNRTKSLKKITLLHDRYSSLNSFGLPKGLLYKITLNNAIKRVKSLSLDFKSFDLICAYKLTFEGPIAYHLHENFGTPYIIFIQQSDFKILKYKPHMREYFYNILLKAQKVVIFSPWIKDKLFNFIDNEKINKIIDKFVLLPIIVEQKMLYKKENNDRFLTIFHFKKENIKIKNINRVLIAVRKLNDKGTPMNLDIIGDGPYKWKIENKINKLKLTDRVRLLGKIDNKNIVDAISNYKAFILCSFPETFGMVYIEALLSGLPIIYSKGNGIDGYFNNKEIGLKVNHRSIYEIEDALLKISNNFMHYKENVKLLQEGNGLSIFTRAEIRKKILEIFSIKGTLVESTNKGGLK